MSSTRRFAAGPLMFSSLFGFFRIRNLYNIARQAIAIALIISLVSNNTLAATGIVSTAAGLSQDMHLWWHASGWAAAFSSYFPGKPSNLYQSGWDGKGAPKRDRPAPEPPEKKDERERKIARVKIFPGDVTIQTGEQVVLTAIAYDKAGAAIGGLDYKWEGQDEDTTALLAVSPKATFSSGSPGRFKLTVDVAGRKDHVRVTVTGVERKQPLSSEPSGTVSSSDKPKPKPAPTPGKTSLRAPVGGNESKIAGKLAVGAMSRAALRQQQTRAAASPLSYAAAFQGDPYDYTWNANNYTTSDDPGTERGNVPGHSVGGSGSGNFQFTAPVLGLDGRGIDLNLALNYNSRLWHKSGTDMYFDIDRDWIPGWSLGFGKIVVANNAYMLIDGDGTRHSYSGTARGNFPSPATSLQTFEGYTTDGSFINYYAEGYKTQLAAATFSKHGRNSRTEQPLISALRRWEPARQARSSRHRSPTRTAITSRLPIATIKAPRSKQLPIRSDVSFSFTTTQAIY